MGPALLRGDVRFSFPAGRPHHRRRRDQPQRHPFQLLRHGDRPRRYERHLRASARGGPHHAAGRRHRLRLLDASPEGSAGQGGGCRRFRPALLHGCVGCDVPHDHERRPPSRRDDGDLALRPSGHRGLRQGQARARASAHVQSLGAGDRRLRTGGEGGRALGAQIRRRHLQGGARPRSLGRDHARDLRLCRAGRDLHRPHQPSQQFVVLRDYQFYQPVRHRGHLGAHPRRSAAGCRSDRQPIYRSREWRWSYLRSGGLLRHRPQAGPVARDRGGLSTSSHRRPSRSPRRTPHPLAPRSRMGRGGAARAWRRGPAQRSSPPSRMAGRSRP